MVEEGVSFNCDEGKESCEESEEEVDKIEIERQRNENARKRKREMEDFNESILGPEILLHYS